MRRTTTKNSNRQEDTTASSNSLPTNKDGYPDSITWGNDDEFQSAMLAGVSRTFALTIPQLPKPIRKVVSNAYLLCRTVDTIEDEPMISSGQKKEFCALFLEILQGVKDAHILTARLAPLLSSHTIPAEHQLIQELKRVVEITKKFEVEQQRALIRCVKVMSEGMVYFQQHASIKGLKNQAEMDKYCYHVAGVVGEMLTELFCYYSNEISKNGEVLFRLSRSFGQGLQMTNILKDIWDDHKREACWLPRDLFEKRGLDLGDLKTVSRKKEFREGLKILIGIAHSHLTNALKYTLLIPANEKGIREFCLWALCMAILTLRKINLNLNFTESDQVKISRNSVKATVIVTGLLVRNDALLKLLFERLGKGLNKVPLTDNNL